MSRRNSLLLNCLRALLSLCLCARILVTPLFDALERVTAREVTSPGDSPPFERAAMDGYAVRAADFIGAGTLPLLRVTGEGY